MKVNFKMKKWIGKAKYKHQTRVNFSYNINKQNFGIYVKNISYFEHIPMIFNINSCYTHTHMYILYGIWIQCYINNISRYINVCVCGVRKREREKHRNSWYYSRFDWAKSRIEVLLFCSMVLGVFRCRCRCVYFLDSFIITRFIPLVSYSKHGKSMLANYIISSFTYFYW